MAEAFANIGQFFQSGAGQALMKGGIGGAGFLQNWLANREAHKKQQFVQDLITNPAKFQALVQGAQQPLSKGLTTDVARQTDAYGAERGLGSSPAIMKDVYAQALAPYQQQEQQMAIQSVLQRLGIYADQPTTKPVDLTSIFKMFQTGGGGGGGVTGEVPVGTGAPLPPDVYGLSGPLPEASAGAGATLPSGGDF